MLGLRSKTPRTSATLAVALIVTVVLGTAQAEPTAVSPRRLPEVPRCELPDLLEPEVVLTAAALPLEAPGREVIRIAGGVATLRAPTGWSAVELPRGQQVCVALTPRPETMAPLAPLQSAPRDGVWVAWQAVAAPQGFTFLAAQRELEAIMPERLRDACGEQAVRVKQQPLVTQGFAALRVDFETIASGHDASNDLRPSDLAERELRGWHYLVRTPAGIFEAHASAPRRHYQQRQPELESVLRSLRFAAPGVKRG